MVCGNMLALSQAASGEGIAVARPGVTNAHLIEIGLQIHAVSSADVGASIYPEPMCNTIKPIGEGDFQRNITICGPAGWSCGSAESYWSSRSCWSGRSCSSVNQGKSGLNKRVVAMVKKVI